MSSQTKKVITRYAPSPTGKFHIGGARTAIFNYLFAKKHHGSFILRIEDTDVERNVDQGKESQFDNLKWMKIFPDESFNNPGSNGPYLQSQKILHYQNMAEKLLEEKKAYRCFCTSEELDAHRQLAAQKGFTPKYSQKCRFLNDQEIEQNIKDQKPFAIRLKIDETADYKWTDLVRGKISFPGDSMSDYVILRSNKIPTYNFAVVIDDFDMKISHVLRGEEHIANTPYQIATYQAFNWTESMPLFGHLSIIVNENGKKLSKRDESVDQFIESYHQKGYVPEAVVNFLALLGWSGREDNVEIMTLEEMIEAFSLEKVGKAPSSFDPKKLEWINGEYLKKMDSQTYWNFVYPFFNIDLGEAELNAKKKEIALLYQSQISYASQLNQLAADLFIIDHNIEEIVSCHKEILLANIDVLEIAFNLFPKSDFDWELSSIRAYLKQIIAQSGKNGKQFYMPLRLAFSYKDHGPELFRVIQLLGYNLSKSRLEATLKLLKQNNG